jgi:tetraacyldisaccharide 4'-kinase
VAYVAEILAASGEKVCILTRGYGRERPRWHVVVSDGKRVLVDHKTGGDEPVELAQKLLGKASVVADADRVTAARRILSSERITAFVLDDGFQHRKAKRDLDIVCIDATDPFGNGHVLPAGKLREPLANLARADVVVITRANLIDDLSALTEQIRVLNDKAVVLGSQNRITEITRLEDFLAGRKTLDDDDALQFIAHSLAFCGLGNPSAFFRELEDSHFNPEVKKTFADHHFYRQGDIKKLETLARSAGATGLLTTAKDAVKLSDVEFTMPCFVVETELVLNDAERFRRLISSS